MSEFTISQIAEALYEPFPSKYVEWKPQQVSKDGTKALAAAYVDARRYQERLDLICPDWSSKIELLADGRVAKVSLTIAGVTREEVGEAEPSDPNTVTTAVAQAFKRACAAFGLGRYLYFLPLVWVDYDSQRKKLLNTPPLPEWALSPAERLEKATARATEREAAEKALRELGYDEPEQSAPTPEAVPYAEPTAPEAELADPSQVIVHFGRYKDKTLAEIWGLGKEGQGWVRWAAAVDGKGFDTKNDPKNIHLQRMARAFLSLQAAYAS
ncbi:MAG: hypothetical protein KatS3mg046_803 [Bellilinea sp.]|nr:MAG: hypothetical protein KatS3mg046_803 [Bellilinea sp.]